ncbi:hypothetical protein RCL1_001631 [Eukaryota sp. TZLM3-RCL]
MEPQNTRDPRFHQQPHHIPHDQWNPQQFTGHMYPAAYPSLQLYQATQEFQAAANPYYSDRRMTEADFSYPHAQNHFQPFSEPRRRHDDEDRTRGHSRSSDWGEQRGRGRRSSERPPPPRREREQPKPPREPVFEKPRPSGIVHGRFFERLSGNYVTTPELSRRYPDLYVPFHFSAVNPIWMTSTLAVPLTTDKFSTTPILTLNYESYTPVVLHNAPEDEISDAPLNPIMNTFSDLGSLGDLQDKQSPEVRFFTRGSEVTCYRVSLLLFCPIDLELNQPLLNSVKVIYGRKSSKSRDFCFNFSAWVTESDTNADEITDFVLESVAKSILERLGFPHCIDACLSKLSEISYGRPFFSKKWHEVGFISPPEGVEKATPCVEKVVTFACDVSFLPKTIKSTISEMGLDTDTEECILFNNRGANDDFYSNFTFALSSVKSLSEFKILQESQSDFELSLNIILFNEAIVRDAAIVLARQLLVVQPTYTALSVSSPTLEPLEPLEITDHGAEPELKRPRVEETQSDVVSINEPLSKKNRLIQTCFKLFDYLQFRYLRPAEFEHVLTCFTVPKYIAMTLTENLDVGKLKKIDEKCFFE